VVSVREVEGDAATGTARPTEDAEESGNERPDDGGRPGRHTGSGAVAAGPGSDVVAAGPGVLTPATTTATGMQWLRKASGMEDRECSYPKKVDRLLFVGGGFSTETRKSERFTNNATLFRAGPKNDESSEELCAVVL